MRVRYFFLLAAASLLVPCVAAGEVAQTGFSVSMDGLTENPPNASPGYGAGTVVMNNAQTQITYYIPFASLLAPRIASHIHGPASPTMNASVIIPLIGTAATSGSLSGVAACTARQAAIMLHDSSYVNIHTSPYPGGEIRGNLHLDVTPTRATTWGRLKKIYH